MSNTPDSAREQANNDFNRGNAPANTSTWETPLRETYDAEYAQRERERQERSR